jgi:hypothetical protein
MIMRSQAMPLAQIVAVQDEDMVVVVAVAVAADAHNLDLLRDMVVP